MINEYKKQVILTKYFFEWKESKFLIKFSLLIWYSCKKIIVKKINLIIGLWNCLITLKIPNFWWLPIKRSNLHNYFNIHVCPSFRRRRRPSRHTFEFSIPAGVWQSVTNISWLVCVNSEKYIFLVTIRPLWSMRQGEGKLHTLWHKERGS